MGVFIDAIREAAGMLSSGALDVREIVGTSLKVSLLATLIGLTIGIPAGFVLGGVRFFGRRALLVLASTGMGLPPVVVGLFVVMLLSRRGPLGTLQALYTTEAMVFAQVIIATPLIVAITAAAVASVPRDLRLQARSLGASRLQEAMLTLREARFGVAAAVAAGFGAIISEVGAVMMVGGNISGQTRVMTTAIVQEARKGHFGLALALGGVLLTLVLVVNVFLATHQHADDRYSR